MNLHSIKFGIKILNKHVCIEYKLICSIISDLKHYEGIKITPHRPTEHTTCTALP